MVETYASTCQILPWLIVLADGTRIEIGDFVEQDEEIATIETDKVSRRGRLWLEYHVELCLISD